MATGSNHTSLVRLLSAAGANSQLLPPEEPHPPMMLLGLVQHMAEVERNWLQRVLAGQDVPPVFGKSNHDGFALQSERGLDEAVTAWQAEVSCGRELVANAGLDDSGHLSEQEAGHVGDKGVSLRWTMVNMIE
ncbi:hypothetical protein BZZ08_00640 [Streptomyces sp. MH60]|nr:hypothetical protein BZZ08_00640 [Streptomyces sp. MH60]